MVALFWLLGTEKSWKPFVSNHVEEIIGRYYQNTGHTVQADVTKLTILLGD